MRSSLRIALGLVFAMHRTSPRRGEGRGEGRVLAGTCVLSVGAHLCATATHGCTAPSACRAQVRSHSSPAALALSSGSWLLALGSWLLALGSQGSPYDAAGGWRKARRVARMDAGQFFARAGCPVEKPRSPPAHLEGAARKARHPGGPSLWLLSLGQARESDPASGRRSEARGRRASWRQRDNQTPRL